MWWEIDGKSRPSRDVNEWLLQWGDDGDELSLIRLPLRTLLSPPQKHAAFNSFPESPIRKFQAITCDKDNSATVWGFCNRTKANSLCHESAIAATISPNVNQKCIECHSNAHLSATAAGWGFITRDTTSSDFLLTSRAGELIRIGGKLAATCLI